MKLYILILLWVLQTLALLKVFSNQLLRFITHWTDVAVQAWRMTPSSGKTREVLTTTAWSVSYCEAVFCLELVVHITDNPVKIFHLLTGHNVPENTRQDYEDQ